VRPKSTQTPDLKDPQIPTTVLIQRNPLNPKPPNPTMASQSPFQKLPIIYACLQVQMFYVSRQSANPSREYDGERGLGSTLNKFLYYRYKGHAHDLSHSRPRAWGKPCREYRAKCVLSLFELGGWVGNCSTPLLPAWVVRQEDL
jgi:hypothetical protein